MENTFVTANYCFVVTLSLDKSHSQALPSYNNTALYIYVQVLRVLVLHASPSCLEKKKNLKQNKYFKTNDISLQKLNIELNKRQFK